MTQFDPALSWRDVEWIKGLWPGKLVIKGVLDADDAQLAVESGADAIVVSNHGGRQLDGAPSTISALPKIAEAVGGETEVLLDSGVRTGQDIFRALALGARAVMIGRAYVYGLGAEGERGVSKALRLLGARARRDDGAGGGEERGGDHTGDAGRSKGAPSPPREGEGCP